jgi:GntR family transcriptional regulator, transcriptional repressor for pyruvate dehydrogenase complex
MKKQGSGDTHAAKKVVERVRLLVRKGALTPGDKMPPEREFALQLGISRASLRAGIAQLAAMGLVVVKHGVGAFLAESPLPMNASSFDLVSSVHRFSPEDLYEARLALEGCLAGMAARHRNDQQLTALSEVVADMYATIEAPREYLLHDIRFHRVIAQAAGNPILVLLMETIAASFYDTRRKAEPPSGDLKQAADMHRRIYRAIRDGNAEAARAAMEAHLRSAALRLSGKTKRRRTLITGKPSARAR